MTPGDARDALLLSEASVHLVDAMFVLASVLTGTSQRRQLQDYLVSLGALPVLLRGLITVPWASAGASGAIVYPRIHGPDCKCMPDTEGPVQLMRLTHALMDRDAAAPGQRWLTRRRLMTEDELNRAFSRYGGVPSSGGSGGAALDGVPQRQSVPSFDGCGATGSASDCVFSCGPDGRCDRCRPLNEAALLLDFVPAAACRPWGWASARQSHGMCVSDGAAQLQQRQQGAACPPGCVCHAFVAGAVKVLRGVVLNAECSSSDSGVGLVCGGSSSGTGSSSADAGGMCVIVRDPVMRGLNAAWEEPFDLHDIDIDIGGDIGSGSAALSPSNTGAQRNECPPLDPGLTIDATAAMLCGSSSDQQQHPQQQWLDSHTSPHVASSARELRTLLAAARSPPSTRKTSGAAASTSSSSTAVRRAGAASAPREVGNTASANANAATSSVSPPASSSSSSAVQGGIPQLQLQHRVPAELADDPSAGTAEGLSTAGTEVAPPSPSHGSPHSPLAPRGIASLVCIALRASLPTSPYRMWLASIAESFVRGSPRPVREWAGLGHGLLATVMGTVMDSMASAEEAAARKQRQRDTALALQLSGSPTTAAPATATADAVELTASDRFSATPSDHSGGEHGGADNAVSGGGDGDTSRSSGGSGDGAGDDSPRSAGSGVAEDDGYDEHKHSLQCLLDMLGELVKRSPASLAQWDVVEREWLARRQQQQQQRSRTFVCVDSPVVQSTNHSDASVANEREPSTVVVAPLACTAAETYDDALLRYACNRLDDSNVMLRSLCLTEDWAYGLVAADRAVAGDAAAGSISPSSPREASTSPSASALASTADDADACANSADTVPTAFASVGFAATTSPADCSDIVGAQWSWESLSSITATLLSSAVSRTYSTAVVPAAVAELHSACATFYSADPPRSLPPHHAPAAAAPSSSITCSHRTLYPLSTMHIPALRSTPLTFIRHYRLPLLLSLMAGLPAVSSFSREDLCMLNSALVVFMTAHRHCALPGLVAQLREYAAAVQAEDEADVRNTQATTAATGDSSSSGGGGVGGGGCSGNTTGRVIRLPRVPGAGPIAKVAAGAAATSSYSTLREDDSTLGAVALSGATAAAAPSSFSRVLDKFFRLLCFWLEYYSLREADRTQLRFFGYGFVEWRAVVRGLLGLDPVTETAAAAAAAAPATADTVAYSEADPSRQSLDAGGWSLGQTEALSRWIHACGERHRTHWCGAGTGSTNVATSEAVTAEAPAAESEQAARTSTGAAPQCAAALPAASVPHGPLGPRCQLYWSLCRLGPV